MIAIYQLRAIRLATKEQRVNRYCTQLHGLQFDRCFGVRSGHPAIPDITPSRASRRQPRHGPPFASMLPNYQFFPHLTTTAYYPFDASTIHSTIVHSRQNGLWPKSESKMSLFPEPRDVQHVFVRCRYATFLYRKILCSVIQNNFARCPWSVLRNSFSTRDSGMRSGPILLETLVAEPHTVSTQSKESPSI